MEFRHIAIEGPIGVGKSALATRLGAHLDGAVVLDDTDNPFLADFAARVHREVERGEHYNGGAEYVLYADMIRRNKGMDLRYPGSVQFRGADQLIEMGLIRDLTDFGEYPIPANAA